MNLEAAEFNVFRITPVYASFKGSAHESIEDAASMEIGSLSSLGPSPSHPTYVAFMIYIKWVDGWVAKAASPVWCVLYTVTSRVWPLSGDSPYI